MLFLINIYLPTYTQMRPFLLVVVAFCAIAVAEAVQYPNEKLPQGS